MSDEITPRRFHEADGVDDWRVIGTGACAYFRTRSFARGLELANAIGELADAANHHPDVDIRYMGVTVRLFTHDVRSLTERDLSLARGISQAARDLGIDADPTRVQDVELTIDAMSRPAVVRFWQAVLGYRQVGDDDLVDRDVRSAPIWFQQMDEPRAGRNRIHLDVFVPHDQAEARVAAALEAGGRIVQDGFAPAWWTLADPEGNEVDVATWMGRD
ncbi:MAG TPA: VOC family protein [Actinomycetota bacterium]|nr:VOC family protein [Actinomycetota bacterium]